MQVLDHSQRTGGPDRQGRQRNRRGWPIFAAGLALVVLGLGVYANCLDNPLIIDDKVVIEGDPRVHEGRYLELLTGEYWPGANGNLLYRPLTSLTLALNRACSPRPQSLRLPNLVLHTGVGVLVLLLTVRLTGSLAGGFAAGAVFVVHPIHTAVLNSVVDRAEVGSAFFAMVVLLLWWPGRRGPRAPGGEEVRATGLVLVALCAAISFAAALLFKENAITFLAVVALADLCRFDRAANPGAATSSRRVSLGRRFWLCYAPLLVVAGLYLSVRSAVLGAVVRPVDDIGVVDNIIAHPDYGLDEGESRLLARWGTPVAVFGEGCALLVHPKPLSWDYSYAAIEAVTRLADRRFVGGALWFLAIATAMAISYSKRRLVFFCLGFVLVTYSVVSNTVVIIGSVFAERYLYLPSVGFCMLVGVVVASGESFIATRKALSSRWIKGLLAVVLLGVLGYLADMTVSRNGDFVSEANLNHVDLGKYPRSCRLLAAVAEDRYAVGDFAGTMNFGGRAIDIFPGFTPAWQLVGLAQWRSGRADLALRTLQKASALGADRSEQVAVAIADIYKARGDYRSAIAVLDGFVARDAAHAAASARNNLAWYLITAEPEQLRDPERALAIARRAVEIDGGQADFIDTLTSALLEVDRADEAIVALKKLIPTVNADDPSRRLLVERLRELQGGRGRPEGEGERDDEEAVPFAGGGSTP